MGAGTRPRAGVPGFESSLLRAILLLPWVVALSGAKSLSGLLRAAKTS